MNNTVFWESQKGGKGNPVPGGAASPDWGLGAELTTCSEEIITAKPGCNLTESSKEGCDSKRANVLPVMLIIIFIICGNRLFRVEEFVLETFPNVLIMHICSSIFILFF
jgi:hypothetical protein